ncbi:MAG: phosphate transporter substrate-binding protein PhoT family [Gemmatimonadetes bacterium]|nr:phosphate transporter substrate-binding protein PhoT family [Gemmatimonadota bacterium]
MKNIILVASLGLATLAGGAHAQGVDLTGAGATFPFPIYTKWFSTYAGQTGVKINYQSIGSGGGIRQISEETVDFGATDGPMSDDEMSKAKGGRILHVPTVIGAVAVTYNVPEVRQPLRLDGATLVAIYLGKVAKWNDARIAALNPGVALPSRNILVVRRSDGSGTSYIFTDYLASVSKEWAAGPGRGKDVAWPVGLGAKGNEGVAGQVRQLPGSIGYVELAYVKQNKLQYAAIRNADGEFVEPSVAGATAAAAGKTAKLSLKSDYRISIVNAPGKAAYPISSFTWILVYQNQADGEKAKKLTDFLTWALTKGQSYVEALDYSPLPTDMAKSVIARLASVRVLATR